MKKRSLMNLTAIIATIFLVFIPTNSAFAIADGTYNVNYEMKESGSENTSIADGYFTKPAKLTVENGVKYIQLTVTGSNYIKSLSAPSGPVTVVSENKSSQTRTVKFRVDGDLSNPVNMSMHIVVPDMYDTTHTARAVFNVSGLPKASTAGTTGGSTDASTTTGSNGEVVDNPPTSDNTPLGFYALLLVGSAIGFVAIRKLRPAGN